MTVTPSIYVACTTSYIANNLHGKWIEATQPVEKIESEINQMLKISPYSNEGNYLIHDYRGFETHKLFEYEYIHIVREIALFIKENGLLGSELVNRFRNIYEAQDYLENTYCGCFPSLESFARHYVKRRSVLLLRYIEQFIDYKQMAAEMILNDKIFKVHTEEGIHICWEGAE